MRKFLLAASLLTFAAAQPAFAGDKSVKKTYAVVNEDFGVPVFPYDMKDRAYEVVGEVTAGVRKATAFSKAPSQQKVYNELWERAEKLGADAVINASYGDSHVTAFSWGKVNAKGTAIKFKAAAPVAVEAAAPTTGQ